jgi:hypothetical protein
MTALRERPGDAVWLAEMLAGEGAIGLTLSEDAKSWIKSYDWPGNANELTHVIETASRRVMTSVLTADDLRRVVANSPRIELVTPSEELSPKNLPEQQGKRFKAEAPYRLHWDEPTLLDANKQKILITDELHYVLKGLMSKEEGGGTKDYLTFAEIRAIYKNLRKDRGRDPNKIGQAFARNLRRCLKPYGILRHSLIKTWKSRGYKRGDDWAPHPVVYGSEAGLVHTDDLERIERNRVAKETGRKKLAPRD